METETTTGILVFLAGLTLRGLAGIYLVEAGWHLKDALLVTSPPGIATGGPYRFLKHPAYIGSLLMIAGAGLVALGWGGAIVSFAALPFYQARMVEEEALLKERRGENNG